MDGLTAVYLGVLLVSVLLLIASLISGIGHDSDFSHEIAHDHDAGHDAGHGDLDGPYWLSSRVILGAAAGFGAFGLGAQAVGLTGWTTVPAALVGLFGMAGVVRQFVLKPLWRQQSNTLLSRYQYVGSRGRVTLGIRSGETGLVRFLDPNGTPVTEFAMTADGTDLAAGTDILVVDVTEQHVIVDPDPLKGT